MIFLILVILLLVFPVIITKLKTNNYKKLWLVSITIIILLSISFYIYLRNNHNKKKMIDINNFKKENYTIINFDDLPSISNMIKTHSYRKNTGLGKDFDIYLSLLNNSTLETHARNFSSCIMYEIHQGDEIITLEHIPINKCKNGYVFIPNQELVDKIDEEMLLTKDHVRLVLCKNNYSYNIFSEFKKLYNCSWLVDKFIFSSIPKPNSELFCNFPKSRLIYFHPAGKSWMKNTAILIATWRNNPQWPDLYITCADHCISNANINILDRTLCKNIHFYELLPKKEFIKLQKHAGFVILPSACEGFGHSLYESIENGNLLITTDIPPINEFFTDMKNCLLIKPNKENKLGYYNTELKYVNDLSNKAGNSGSSCFSLSEKDIKKVVEKSFLLTPQQYNNIRRFALQNLLDRIPESINSTKQVFSRHGFDLVKDETIHGFDVVKDEY